MNVMKFTNNLSKLITGATFEIRARENKGKQSKIF